MPELPEVECLTRAVRSVVKGGRLVEAAFLRKDLRDPIPIEAFRAVLEGQVIEDVFRRSKYLLMRTRKGFGVFHLGMTGNILERQSAEPEAVHTHAVFTVRDRHGKAKFLHFVDPRRFGRIACVEGEDYGEHALFAGLGPEPLDCKDLGGHLFAASRGKQQPVKSFIMDAGNVVGVGNIYASEALFRAGISPRRKAGTVTKARFDALAKAISVTLEASIKAGGTTFRDFRTADGSPGYYAVLLNVYDRAGESCKKCGKTIRQLRQSGRSTFYCAFCQS